MTDAVIVAAARTPIGRAHKGSLVDVDAFELGKVAVGAPSTAPASRPRTSTTSSLAESLQGGGVIARYVAVELGLHSVPGLADNRHCAAGLSAVQIAAGSIRAGMDRVVVAGGTESLSSMVMGQKSVPASAKDPQLWMSPSQPAHARGPAVRHGDHGRREHRPHRRRHPGGRRRVGLPLAHPGRPRPRRGLVRPPRSCRSRCPTAPAAHARSPATSTPGPTPRSRSWPSLPVVHPELEKAVGDRGQRRRASTTPRPP